MKTVLRVGTWWAGLLSIAVLGMAPAVTPAAAGQDCYKKAKVGADCVSCDAAVLYQQKLLAAGGAAEIIPIDNGVMVIYTSLNPVTAGSVQNVALERWSVWEKIVAGAADGHMCGGCCSVRQVMARSHRHAYKTSTGVIALVTAEEPVIVREIQKMAMKRKPTAER